MVFRVPIGQRPNAKMRVDQLKYDIRHLQAVLPAWRLKRQRTELEKNEREQLLNRRFTPNSETSIDIDYSLQHNSSMMNAHRGVDDMLFTGHNALRSLKSQGDKVKAARRRILDIENTLGLSNHTLRLIHKRLSEDKYVLFISMIVTLIFIVLILWFFVF